MNLLQFLTMVRLLAFGYAVKLNTVKVSQSDSSYFIRYSRALVSDYAE